MGVALEPHGRGLEFLRPSMSVSLLLTPPLALSRALSHSLSLSPHTHSLFFSRCLFLFFPPPLFFSLADILSRSLALSVTLSLARALSL